ncbi:MAG TPA: aldolase/citrate lyase family protein [Pirellulaceae bacterium]|nr:aldolase/citrate lyase family protein [Pirellulaceae bacterium]
MRNSKVKAKLRRGEPVLLTTLHLTDPSLFELVGLMGFDGIWMDLEHHGYSVETASAMMRAARVGHVDIMARPAKGEFMRMGRLLEAGAQGIMYPRCDSADEARQVVTWSKFAPLGRRGFDGGNPDMPYCTMPMAEYVRKANEETFVVVQIEDEGAVSRIDEIAAVEGVDVLFFGPADFTVLSGVPGQFDHPKVQNAIAAVAAAAAKHGKNWGMPSGTVERTQQLLDLGARFICHGADLIWVKNGLEEVQRRFAPLGFTFERKG